MLFHSTRAFAHDGQGSPLSIFSLEHPHISSYGIEPISLAALVAIRLQSLKSVRQTNSQNLIKVEFQTPTRIRIADEINPLVTFSEFIKKITERLEFAAFLHADHSQKIDYRPLINSGLDIEVEKSFLNLYRFEQFSNAQNRKTSRDAVLGSIYLSGQQMERILPILLAGEILNIGSNCSYGFGKYIISEM